MATVKFKLIRNISILSFIVISYSSQNVNSKDLEQTEYPSLKESKNHSNETEMFVNLFLYTKLSKDNPKAIIINESEVILDANFNGTKPTKFIIHGFQSNKNSEVIQKIKDAYLQKYDYNVIAVDWNVLASYNYIKAQKSTKHVGQIVATVINYMVKVKNVKLDNIHVIGHSLGAHVAGFAGMFSGSEVGKIARITGLDPALPGYRYDTSNHLDPTDATFVDVIHSCSGVYGMTQTCGHVDFFPNGGECFQPGCKIPIAVCSHSRSYLYFSESIIVRDGFMSRKCESKAVFDQKKCKGDSALIPMGDAVPISALGSYFLLTQSGPTFAQSKDLVLNIYPSI